MLGAVTATASSTAQESGAGGNARRPRSLLFLMCYEAAARVPAALAANVRSALHDSIASMFEVDGCTESRLAGHQRILDAVMAGDCSTARAAVTAHLAATHEMLARIGHLSAPRATRSVTRDPEEAH